MKDFIIESKVVKINHCDERIFRFLSDFRNFDRVMPPDIKDWQSDENSCSFIVKGQRAGLQFVDKEPFKTLKLSGSDQTPYDFNFWIQLKNLSNSETALKMTIKADLNMLLRTAVKKPLKQFLDQLADQLKIIPYS
jgi:carbon monoxide dehydrogenase subunit G